MPHPGLKVATNPDFDGKLSGMHELFKMFACCIEDHSQFATYLQDAA
jgi:hypothetical protein